MKTLCIFSTLLFVLSNAVFATDQGSPWPYPHVYVTGLKTLLVPDNLTFVSNLKGCEVLDKAFDRYKKTILATTCAQAKVPPPERHYYANADDTLQSVNVEIQGKCETWPSVAMIEQYSIEINTPYVQNNAEIKTASVWGAIRALETLSQLVYVNDASQLTINTTTILDFPRFTFRGMMLDTARHFVPLNIILENLDAMVQNKLNVFHWHIVDDQSFPYQSVKFPDLSQKGAFNSKTHVYSFDDIAKVIDYARLRGIRVIPEFDTPGHTQSWGPGKPGLLTPCYTRGLQDGTFGPINPIVNDSYAFLKDFLAEAGKVFPEQYMHLGGDEVSFDCWKSNPDILSFMQKQGFGQDFAKLEQFYEQKLIQIVSTLGKNFIVWQEVFDNKVNISKNTLIHIWKDGYHAELADVTKAGFNAILSSCWYLNDISYGIDWPTYYKCDPWDFVGSDEQRQLVIGGAACMWGEFVDGSNLISRTWPRACAVAERLWSSASLTDANVAVPRLEEQRCRMLQRGLRVEPANGPGYCPCDIYF